MSISHSLPVLPTVRLSLESLEARITPATPLLPGISASLLNGILTIRGTPGPDDIVVSRDLTNRIDIWGLSQSFPVKSVHKIEVHGGAGDDYIDLDSGLRPGERTLDTYSTIYGEAGNDTIFGGNA